MIGRPPARVYRTYGLRLRSPWPLPCPEERGYVRADIELREGDGAAFSPAAGVRLSEAKDWFRYARLPDGSDYLRWSGLFEFVVSADGDRVACRPLGPISGEAFHTYLLGQVLSFALVKRGIEPFHSTAVVVGGEAVGFLGDCGYGKSSLGAAFLQAGHALVTDDLLVLKESDGRFLAYPGAPRIKLFPDIGRSLLGGLPTGVPMNRFTPKLVIPLGGAGRRFTREATPLRAIYVLARPGGNSGSRRISIRRLSPRRACVELVRNTFNPVVLEPARLRRQFELAARIARTVPVKALSFPRRLAYLPAVREAIHADLAA